MLEINVIYCPWFDSIIAGKNGFAYTYRGYNLSNNLKNWQATAGIGFYPYTLPFQTNEDDGINDG